MKRTRPFLTALGMTMALSMPSLAWADDTEAPESPVPNIGGEMPDSDETDVDPSTEAGTEADTGVQPTPATMADIGVTDEPRERDTNVLTEIGTDIMVGGGVFGFTSGEMADMANPGGTWMARIALGMNNIVGFEAGYAGSAQGIHALGLATGASLVSNGLDGVARVNLPITTNLGRGQVTPYAFGGAGWRNYSLNGADFNLSSVRASDNVFEIPLGAGLSYAIDRIVFDARFTYRAAFDEDLIRPTIGNDDAPGLDSWSAAANAGFRF